MSEIKTQTKEISEITIVTEDPALKDEPKSIKDQVIRDKVLNHFLKPTSNK